MSLNLLLIVFGILVFALTIGVMIWALVDIWRSKRLSKKAKIIWTICILITPLLGAIFWFLVRDYLHEFVEIVKTVKQKPGLLSVMIIFDICIVLSFYLLRWIADSLTPTSPEFAAQLQNNVWLFIFVVFLLLVYIVLLIFAFSYFTQLIIQVIKLFFGKSKYEIKRIWNFLTLNTLLFCIGVMFLILFLLLIQVTYGQNVWLFVIVLIVMIIISLFLYAFVSFSHSLFGLGLKVREIIKKSLKYTFMRIKKYLGLFGWSVFILVAYMVVYALIGAFVWLVFNNIYQGYVEVAAVVAMLIMYILFCFNRVYFFYIAKKLEEKRK